MKRWHTIGLVTTLAGAVILLAALFLFASGNYHEDYAGQDVPPAIPSAAPPFNTLSVGTKTLLLEGKPFFINGDAAWSLLVVPSEQEAIEYLRTRRAQGFNAILVNLIESYVGGPRNHNGDFPFVRRQDFDHPNERYFAHADRIFSEAARLGMVVLLAPAYVGYECGREGWCDVMRKVSDERLQRYGQYVGNRYRNFSNIVWVHGGDADARRFNIFRKVAAVATGIRHANGPQLHTAHCARNLSGGECYAELQLDFDTAYASCTTTLDAIDRMHRQTYHSGRSSPFLYIEGTYENMKETPNCIRDQFLLSTLGGASGHVFGIEPVWNFEINWKRHLDSPGSRHVRSLWMALDLSRRDDWSVVSRSPSLRLTDSPSVLRNGKTGMAFIYQRALQEVNLASTGDATQTRTCWINLDKLDWHTRQNPFDIISSLRHSTTCRHSGSGRSPASPGDSDKLMLVLPSAADVQHPWDHF